jgi:hypothetical protein
VCKVEEAVALLTLPLLGTVPLHCGRVCGAVLLPVARMIGTPFACALAAHLAVLGVGKQLLLAVVGAAALLADGLGAGGLLRMAWGRLELLIAITAPPRTHFYSVRCPAQLYSWLK